MFTKDSARQKQLDSKTIPPQSGWEKLREALAREGNLKSLVENWPRHQHPFLSGEEHTVWKPKYKFADIVTLAENMKKRQTEHKTLVSSSQPEKCRELNAEVQSSQVEKFRLRQKTLMDRVNLAWRALQEEPSTPAASDEEANETLVGEKQPRE